MKNNKYKSLEFCGFPNYLVSPDGEVFNSITGLKLSTFPTGNGKYDRVCLYNEQGCKYFCVHQLVAMAFVPNPNNFNTVDHINFDTHYNHATNLQWLDIKENSRRSWVCGNHDSQKKKVKQLDNNNNTINIFDSIQDAATFVDIDRSCISRACKNGNMSKGYYWSFV